MALESEPTQTIDLKSLFSPDLSASGVYDLRKHRRYGTGKLLEAIPIPIMLIDKWFFVAFANKAFGKISEGLRRNSRSTIYRCAAHTERRGKGPFVDGKNHGLARTGLRGQKNRRRPRRSLR